MRKLIKSSQFFSWVIIGFYVILNSYGALAIKFKINQLGQIDLGSFRLVLTYFLTLFSSPLVISGLGAIFLSAIVWMIALTRLDISVAYPVAVGLNFVVVIFVAVLAYHENLSVNRALGLLLIFVSLFIIYRD